MYYIPTIIICILPIIIGSYILEYQSTLKHIEFHILYILGSSFVSFIISCLAYLEFSRNKESSIFFVCIGFVGVSIFYCYHGLVTPGNDYFYFSDPKSNLNAFVFFGDISRAWFALLLFIPRLIKNKTSSFYNLSTVFLICILIASISFYLIYNPLLIPDVKDSLGKDTNFALLVKVATLTLLGVSAINYFESFRISRKLQTLTLFLGIVYVMHTVNIFLISVPWGPIWWLAHNLYLIAFLIIGFGILISLINKKHQYFNVWNEVEEYIKTIVNRKEHLEKKVSTLDYLANRDYLTGLYNRNYFMRLLDDVLRRSKELKESKEQFAILFIDLDGFKEVNDQYGHVVGDELLKAVADVLVKSTDELDIVSRFGGDEFSMLLYNKSREELIKTANKILESLSQPIRVTHHNCRVSASIGISRYPEDGDTSQILINRSDMSMYEVKRSGKNNYSFFDEIARENRVV